MRLNRDKTTFGRHETFPLRYGWLTKGFLAVQRTPAIFAQPERAMVVLGVGRNMVNAIHYWLQTTGIVAFGEGEGLPTPLGEILLGEGGDPYLEDNATLWIIHWLIASNAEGATGFYWFFNRFVSPRFHDKDLLPALSRFVAEDLQVRRSNSTLKSDGSTLLRMYAPVESKTGAGRGDDYLDSPLSQLELIEAEGGGAYRSPRTLRPFLAPVALHFALAQRLAAESGQPALPVRAILYGSGDWAAPGAVFRLSEEGLMDSLARVMEYYPGCYQLRDTAGVHQLYRGDRLIDPLEILRDHYRTYGRQAA